MVTVPIYPRASDTLIILLACAMLLENGCRQSTFQYEQLPLPPIRVPDDIGALVRIEGGSYMMGAPPDALERPTTPDRITGWVEMASPMHRETVPSFDIGKYPVTATEFCDFLNELKNSGERTARLAVVDYCSTVMTGLGQYMPRPGFEYAPATHIQIQGARRYCEWLSQKTGHRYRLPSEIEWEFAARGTESRTFPWGEETAVGKTYLCVHYFKWNSPDSPGVITVGSFPQGASPEGVHDLIGNLEQWCGNCFYDYTSTSIGADPEAFKAFVNPPRDCKGFTTKSWGKIPGIATRGGQYIDKQHPATGWTRTVHPAEYARGSFARGVGFRVLREVDE